MYIFINFIIANRYSNSSIIILLYTILQHNCIIALIRLLI